MPVTAHIRGYIEIGVNPGIVFTSLTTGTPSAPKRVTSNVVRRATEARS